MNKLNDLKNLGYEEGEHCNRGDRLDCYGIIEEHEKRPCSCHIMPPCSACVDDRAFCPKCDWVGSEEANENQKNEVHVISYMGLSPKPVKLDNTKIDWTYRLKSNSSMIKIGVYPGGTTRTEVEQKVKGTFGGRFDYFGSGKFEYVAYTD